ncbi:arginine--tRNA ligase [bacterium]|nr:MAG: arginine--tRNA ligase [bacterium]
MSPEKKDIQDLLLPLISDSLKDLGLDKLPAQDLILDTPVSGGFGDLSCNVAMRLSREIKEPPVKIAQRVIESIKTNLKGNSLGPLIKEIKVEGAGFINFYLNDAYFHQELKDIVINKGESLKRNYGNGKKVLIEFVSANPTGSLSVAHARQAVVGDVLANIFDFLGFDISREYYLNDEGNQINILGRSVEARLRELEGEKIEFPENYYQGDYIYDIARDAKKAGIKGAENFSNYAGEYILNIIKKELDDFGVKFDCWYSQKALRESGKIDQAFDYLKSKGYLYEQEGALWFKSTAFGDDKDRVVIKSDGSLTYLAPDIAYHQDKYTRGFEWLINLWGPDHHGYIGRLKAAVQAFSQDPESLAIIIVQLASIFREGKPVEMSTRRGQYITLREVLDEVGVDASRFFFIMRRTSSHLSFDLETAKKQTPENPVYYIQYAHARICSILRQTPCADIDKVDFSLLKEKEELELIKKIWKFTYILNICLKTLDPYMLTVYLQEVAESFHRFYDRHRVLGVEPGLTQARLNLILATKIIFSRGLGLIGVSSPEKM